MEDRNNVLLSQDDLQSVADCNFMVELNESILASVGGGVGEIAVG